MLTIVSESLSMTRILTAVARELSLSPGFFANPEGLDKLLGGDKGFRISLDAFGAAASSLSTFEQLPFDEIKIHASLLARARSNPVTMQVLAAVTGVAHNLGISVCAEGVEDQETFEFLKTIECDKMQGFLISEAVMPDIIRRVYSAKSRKVEDVA